MSIEKNRNEGLRWLKTAENDLGAAKIFLDTVRRFFNKELNSKMRK